MIYAFPYIIFYFVLYILSIPVYNFNNKKINAVSGICSYYAIIFLTIIFLGWGIIGYDAYHYYKYFNNISPSINLRQFSSFGNEGYFYSSMSFLKYIIPNYYIFRIINMLIDLILLTIFFRSYCSESLLPMCFLFFFLFGGIYYEIEAIRNAKAVMLYLISLKYYHERRYFIFSLINIIAFGFHVSVAFLFVSTFFTGLFNNKKLVLTIFIIGTFLLIMGIGAGKILGNIAGQYLPGRLGNRVYVYFNLESKGFGAFRGISIGYIERFISFIIIFYFGNTLVSIDKRLKTLIGLFYIFIFICLFFSDIVIIYERIAALFKIPYWILFPLIYKNLKTEQKKYFLVILFFLGLLKTYTQYNDQVYNYMFGFVSPVNYLQR